MLGAAELRAGDIESHKQTIKIRSVNQSTFQHQRFKTLKQRSNSDPSQRVSCKRIMIW